jgi:hypothetical protein
MSNNQSVLQNLALVEELDEQAAETISGGYEVFTVKNKTQYNITLVLDGKTFLQKPNQEFIYTAYRGGKITFDTDGRNGYQQDKSYNLANGGKYEFQDNKWTRGNPYDIDLYSVA